MATDDARTGRSGGPLADRLRQVGVLPTVEPPPRERGAVRAMAAGSISLSGVGLLVPIVAQLFAGGSGVGTGLAVLGSVVAAALVAVGGLLYRSTISTDNAVRIAAWNFLGIAVLGAVMLALFAYQRADGGVIQSPGFVLGTLLAIGAGAHIIIGVYDARRVRAEQLARERRRTAVLNRALRHNIRNGANVILGHADLLAEAVEEGTPAANSAAALRDRATAISDLAVKARELGQYAERPAETYPTDAAEVVERAAAVVRETDPDATVRVGSVADARVVDDGRTARAVEELAENAAEHAGPKPTVDIEARAVDGRAAFVVTDDGPGVPAAERAVVLGDRPITDTDHGSGLGLWLARTVAETLDGEFAVEGRDGETGGTVATLSVPAA
ncbi:sensor histidine kinase [Candidatus Halobonum tyrrellensis]|uniref:histidine kinase n=1 Tax=Candidatus Halobonum tyrrellensis G22 TaxID=1324957 RepID=V4GUH0_9EURY|nr:sensor histidine kinase [Candidatus Halobonum tyrrellensis]ESP88786.1 histidine kinase [Candidatus Halobonum tyrrellensis G22]